MTRTVHPAIRRYVDGEISALRAAAELGDHATVGDVLTIVKAAGLQPPSQAPEQAQIELARARRLLGLDRGSSRERPLPR